MLAPMRDLKTPLMLPALQLGPFLHLARSDPPDTVTMAPAGVAVRLELARSREMHRLLDPAGTERSVSGIGRSHSKAVASEREFARRRLSDLRTRSAPGCQDLVDSDQDLERDIEGSRLSAPSRHGGLTSRPGRFGWHLRRNRHADRRGDSLTTGAYSGLHRIDERT